MERIGITGHDMFGDQPTIFEIRAPDPVPPLRLSLPVRRNLERMAQEALHNAAKYSQAHSVVVCLNLNGARPHLWIRDDGVGFDLDAHSAGLGLESLRRRALRIGATLDIQSSPGAGTTVSITFDPLAFDRRETRT